MHVVQQPGASVQSAEFDRELIARLSCPGPRHSWYPSPERFSDDFGYRDYLQAVAALRTRGSARPLALYLHLPFCEAQCHQGPCNNIVSLQRGKADVYLSYLKREIEMQGRLFAGINQVGQLHLGGGTPACLPAAQMEALMLHLRRCFQFAADEQGEYAIEVDPDRTTPQDIASLRRQGFNHISLNLRGAAGEDRCACATEAIVAAVREARFRSLSINLMCALPQHLAAMASTLGTVIAVAPDRITLCQGARPGQLSIPSSGMLELCIDTLGQAGYVHIGMDHFARLGDALAVAHAQGRLHRNFHGYSTHADADLVACGVSAISAVASTYSQNVKTLDAYYDLIDSNELPIERGIRLSMDDVLRRTIIQMLMCQFELSIPSIEQAYPIDFAQYFAAELARLEQLEREGLVQIEPQWLSVTPKGRILVRQVCAVFDRYQPSAPAPAADAATSSARHAPVI